MLDSITIQGFKSIASLERLALSPVNVLIGPNGSGKSDFLGAFSFLHAICEGRLDQYVRSAGGVEKILHFGSKVTKELSLEVSFAPGDLQYHLTLALGSGDAFSPAREFVRLRQVSGTVAEIPLRSLDQAREAGLSDSGHTDRAVQRMRREVAGWRNYHLNDTSPSSTMRKAAKLGDHRFLKPDASNLAAFLYFLKVREPESYHLIVNTVQLVAPFLGDFILEPLQRSPDEIRIEWHHQDSGLPFDASSLSDGTLRFIALAALFLQPEALRPSVILVDEPEIGLHPAALEILAALMRQAALASQIVVSTQSSLLLDHFAPEDVLVADHAGNATQIRRLDPQRLKTWLEEYSLGQLWEKNEIGGRPASR